MNLVFPAPAAAHVPSLQRRIRVREITFQLESGKVTLNIAREFLDVNGEVFGHPEYLGSVQVNTDPNNSEIEQFLIDEADCIAAPTTIKLENVAQQVLLINNLIEI